MCKECLEIFQEFQTNKRPEGPGLTSDPTSADPRPVPSSSSAVPTPSSVAARLRSVSSSLQKNIAGGGGGGGDSPGSGGGGGDTGTLPRAGTGGNHARAGRQQMAMLNPHKSWDDASSGRSQDDPPSALTRMNVGFDNPASLRPKEGLPERDERLMALNEVMGEWEWENHCMGNMFLGH